MQRMEKLQIVGFLRAELIILFSVSGDRVHISGPDRAQIGSNVSLVCSSEESNPASLIRWRVEGEEKLGSQEVSGVWCQHQSLLTVCKRPEGLNISRLVRPVITILPLYSALRLRLRSVNFKIILSARLIIIPVRLLFQLTNL